jgi:hypothetical protein
MRTDDRNLIYAWLKLMALSGVLAIAADVAHASRLGPGWIAAIALAVIWKSRLVLSNYLGLKAAPSELTGFTSAIFFVVATVALAFAVFATPQP